MALSISRASRLTIRINHLVILLAALVAAPVSAQAGGESGVVAVYVDGLRSTDGDLVVRLYRSADGFPWDRRRAYREVRESAHSRGATLLLDDVPSGPVAVVAFHTEGGGARVRLDGAGRPLDGWAVSGDLDRGFSTAALRVADGGVAVARLRLRYPSDR